MFKLRPSSNTGHVSVIFDIGSASIGVGVALREGKNTKLMWHTRIAYGYQSVNDFDRYVHTMYATVLEAGMKAKNEGIVSIKKKYPHIRSEAMDVYCILNAPWYFGMVQTQEEHGNKPLQITDKVLRTLVHDAYTEVLESKQCKQWQEIMGKGVEFEAFVDSIKVNGYPITTPKNKIAKDVSIQTYISISPKDIQEHISEILVKLFPNHDVHHVSSARLFSGKDVQRCVPVEQKRVVFVEVDGEMTTVYLVKQGTVLSVSTFSHGINHVLREVAPKALSAKEAQDSVGLTLKKVHKVHKKEDIPETLVAPLTKWKKGLSHALQVIGGGVTPPAHVILITNTFWQTLYTVILSDVCMMPGVRKDVMLHVCPLFVGILSEQKNLKNDTATDARLFSITHSLHDYTNKKGMCYTNKKHSV